MTQISLKSADAAVALQLALTPSIPFAVLAQRVGVSVGHAHNAVQRLIHSGLIRGDRREVSKSRLRDLLIYGVPYVFPPQLGPEVRGVPTGHSGPGLRDLISSDMDMVWPFIDGESRGQSLEPLYPAAPAIARSNPDLYRTLTLVDSLRVGRARERNFAREMLTELLS